jgi:hypothetical protein
VQSTELENVTPVDVDFEDSLRLIGYQIDRATAQAGTDLNLTLYWQALGANRPDLLSEVTLVDAENNLIGRSRRWPGDSGTSIQVWDTEKIYADTRTLRVADAATTGNAQLILAVKQGRDGPIEEASRAGESVGGQVTLLTLPISAANLEP